MEKTVIWENLWGERSHRINFSFGEIVVVNTLFPHLQQWIDICVRLNSPVAVKCFGGYEN